MFSFFELILFFFVFITVCSSYVYLKY
jgi:F0F1-type ATP synthase membrane subunit a